MHVGCHEKPAQHSVHTVRDLNIAVIEHRSRIQYQLKEKDSNGRNTDEQEESASLEQLYRTVQPRVALPKREK